jgi:succinoglycan biosynthesis transport protein ExoP
MNGPTFAATSAAPARSPGRPAAPPRPPHKPDADNPAGRMLAYVRLHWLTILFAGALLGAGMGYGAWVMMPPKYESYAMFRVAQVPSTVGAASDPTRPRGAFTTDVKTYATLMKNEEVYRVALMNVKYRLTELPTLKAQKDPLKFLDEKLNVSFKESSEIITLSMLGENPDDVRKIVDAVKEAYISEVINKEANLASFNKERLGTAKTTLEKLLANKGGATTADQPNPLALMPGKDPTKPEPLPAGPFPPADPPKVDNQVKPAGAVGEKKPHEPILDNERMQGAKFGPLMARYMELERSLPDLGFKIAEADMNVNAIKAKLQEVLSEAVPADLEKAVRDNDPEVKQAKDKADRLRDQYTQKSAGAVNPNAPSLLRMAEEVEQADIAAETVARKKVKEADTARRKPRQDQLQMLLDAAKVEQVKLVAKFNQNKAEIERVKAELKTIPTPPEVKAQEAKERAITPSDVEVAMLQEQLKKVSTEYQIADLNASAPPRITKYQDASTPMQKESQKQVLGTVFASMLGFVLVAAVCVGLEMRTRKVTSLAELRSAAPVPVVGVVPHAPDAVSARDPIKRAEVNESIDKLRAYVAQTWLARGATTVAVTSPLGDEGKSFTAFGLASSLAQAGMKTLLVDFDLRNPALHTYAGVPNDLGVCELLRGEADFRRTIQVLPNGLHFLGGGKWSDDARQAAVGGRLEALLGRLKEPFDCVVLHADALLTVAESVEVARRSEVLLLCALYRTTRCPLLKKAADRASAMEIPYTGVVYVGATASEALC